MQIKKLLTFMKYFFNKSVSVYITSLFENNFYLLIALICYTTRVIKKLLIIQIVAVSIKFQFYWEIACWNYFIRSASINRFLFLWKIVYLCFFLWYPIMQVRKCSIANLVLFLNSNSTTTIMTNLQLWFLKDYRQDHICIYYM